LLFFVIKVNYHKIDFLIMSQFRHLVKGGSMFNLKSFLRFLLTVCFLLLTSDVLLGKGDAIRLYRCSGKSGSWDMTLDLDGNPHIVFFYDSLDAYQGPIYYFGSTDSGLTWTLHHRLDEAGTSQGAPSIAVDGSNRLHVVWHEERTEAEHPEIYHKRSIDGGWSWSDTIRLSGAPASWSKGPNVACYDQGIHVVWVDASSGEVHYKRSIDGGASFLGSDYAISSTGGHIRDEKPGLHADANGVHAAYCEDLDERLFYRKSVNWGGSWSSQVTLDDRDNNPKTPNVSSDPTVPTLYVSWRASMPTGQNELFFRRSTTGGNSFGSTQEMPNSENSDPDHGIDCDNGEFYFSYALLGTGEVLLKKSTDGGSTWSQNLVPGLEGTGPIVRVAGTDIHLVWRGTDGYLYYKKVTVEPEPFYFVHITDPHVGYGPLHPYASLRWALAIDYLKNLDDPPDFVLCTGDLVDFGYGTLAPLNWGLLLLPLYQRNSTFYLDENYRIPIYFCPGNHDAAWFDPSSYIFWVPIDFDQYHTNIGPDYYVVKHKRCAIFSLNSGKDANWPNPKPSGDGLSDQYGNEVTNLPLDLDALDGQFNGTDNSNYYKIVMMHHPYLNPRDPTNPLHPEAFWYGREPFINAVDNYDVDLFLCGHIHDGGDCGVKNKYGQDWQSGDGTKFKITNSLDGPFSSRNIWVVPVGPKGYEEIDSVLYFRSTICFQIDGEAVVHVYDQYGNHDGPNENGEIEINIPGSSYHQWISDSLVPNPVYTEFSVFKEDTTNYSFLIQSLIGDTMNIVASSYLTDGIWNKAQYDSVLVYAGSVASLHADGSILDYTMTILDPDSSQREVAPSGWAGNLPPLEPMPPSGPTNIVSNDSSAYVASTTDPENEQVFYMFDWGDETYSDWLGPFSSGDTCVAYHSWMEADSYKVRARAIDVWDHMSGWSDSLSVTVRNRGDANGDGVINLADAVFLVNYLFIGGPPPNPMQAGDANCDGEVDLADAVYIINYLFIGGPPPGC
jgi:predicted MPP superfamily phosphohydrolase